MKKTILALVTLALMHLCKKTESTKTYILQEYQRTSKGTLYIQHVVDTALVIDTIVTEKFNFISDLDLKSPEIYLFLDRGVSNSLDNNLMFAEPGNMTVETILTLILLLK
jgi:hypothetical protein